MDILRHQIFLSFLGKKAKRNIKKNYQLKKMMLKKVLFISGTRADYGKIKPLAKILDNSKKFEISFCNYWNAFI